MQNGAKAGIGATLLVLVVVGVRVGMIYRERNAPEKAVAKPYYKTDDDDFVFLKKKRQSSLADAKELVGSTIWVSAGGQMDYFPYAAHRAGYGKSQGMLLAATPMLIKDAFEQVAPKSATFRIPGGDKQVLLAFTLPQSPSPTK